MRGLKSFLGGRYTSVFINFSNQIAMLCILHKVEYIETEGTEYPWGYAPALIHLLSPTTEAGWGTLMSYIYFEYNYILNMVPLIIWEKI